MKPLRLLCLFLIAAAALSAAAQRTVTPVESDDKKPAAPVLHYYDKHGDPLPEPVLFLASLDTVQSVSSIAKPVYPKLQSIDFGLNFFDAILALGGQKHGGFDLWASLSMWNWVLPTVEVGAGIARSTPQPGNFTYRGLLSPYFKIGADYNFLYKSNPRYRVLAGLRLGYSPFAFNVTDITVADSYWGETMHPSLPTQHSHAWWGEVLAALRVDIVKNFSLGWTLRYHTLFKQPKSAQTTPWYIPGYGARTSPIAVTFSVIYTLPLSTSIPLPMPGTSTQQEGNN